MAVVGVWGIRRLSGRVIGLLGRVTHVLGISTGCWPDLASTGVATAAQHNDDNDGADYGSKANHANYKNNEAHRAGSFLVLDF